MEILGATGAGIKLRSPHRAACWGCMFACSPFPTRSRSVKQIANFPEGPLLVLEQPGEIRWTRELDFRSKGVGG